VVYFAAELLVHFVSEWQSFAKVQKDRQTIIRPLKLHTNVVYFAAELLVYFDAEWWCSMGRNMHPRIPLLFYVAINWLFSILDRIPFKEIWDTLSQVLPFSLTLYTSIFL